MENRLQVVRRAGSNPVIQPATLKVVDASHESTRHLPIEWKRTEEWYDFRDDLDREITVLIRIDERTYRTS